MCEPLALDNANVGIRDACVFDTDDVCFRDRVHAEVIIVIVVSVDKDRVARFNVSLDDVGVRPNSLHADACGKEENKGKKQGSFEQSVHTTTIHWVKVPLVNHALSASATLKKAGYTHLTVFRERDAV